MQHDLKEIMSDLLSIEIINSWGLISAVNVQKLILDNNQGKVDASCRIFSLLCVEIWSGEYLDKN